MVANFEQLLADINTAKNRSQLEYAFDIAQTFLEAWINAAVISTDDYNLKIKEVTDAYNTQLLDLNQNPISSFMGQVYQKAINEVSNEHH